MSQEKFFKFPAYSIILLFAVNFLATRFHWYFSVWYFDMLMHFWGGFSVGLLISWFFIFKNLSFSFKNVFLIMTMVFAVGILWEIFEIIFNNMIAGSAFDLIDTLSDIFFDLIGGFSSIFLYKKNYVYPMK